MNNDSFAALPAAERRALVDTLLRCGLTPGNVCVTKSGGAAPVGGERCVATVTAPGWCGSYEATAGWIALLERDLLALRPARPARRPA